jgi:hypothetical protein
VECRDGVCVADEVAPVDCVVSAWSAWSNCSAGCGEGFEERTRTIVTPASCGGAACPEDLSETQPCTGRFTCGVCTGNQLDVCSDYTLFDGSSVCIGGGFFDLDCCDSNLDCPANWVCITSYTLVLPGRPLQDATCPSDPSKGKCGFPTQCQTAP